MKEIMLYPVRQKFSADKLQDPVGKTRQELERASFLNNLPKGARVAVTAGSRGISNMDQILKTICSVLQDRGFHPFLVPSMGSHGGGTPEGQRKILQGLGVTEETVGFPIKATAEAVHIAQLPDGTPIYQNRIANESDGIIIVNRVKTHTSFKSHVESGLCKMMVVGLGNPAGAENIHRFGVRGLRELLDPMARIVIEKSPILYGMAILENAYEETADIVGVEAADIPDKEPALLARSKEMFPSLPFHQLDLLLVEEIGKCFSGTGMDTNVIGRLRIHSEPEPDSPKIERIVAFDLADASHGNANGIGLADFTTKELVGKIDWKATYLNNLSSTFVQRAMVPIMAETRQEAVQWAIQSLGQRDLESLKVLQISNTLHLDHFWVSAALLDEVKKNQRLEFAGEGRVFDWS